MNKSQRQSPESQPMSRKDRVDKTCDEFDRQWHVGGQPRIEDFLANAEADDREHLLGELLRTELEIRDRAGDSVDPREYHERFREDAAVVQSALAWFDKLRAPPDSLLSTVDNQGDVESRGPSPKTKQPQEELPQEIGRYEIVELLGEGGFARVYLARDRSLDRLVALKVPRLERFHIDDALRVFLDEARKAAQLDHPGIVRIHDVQHEPDRVYIVQQYVKGQDLAKRAKSKSLTPQQIAKLLIAIVDAVGYAHQRGFVHRDLKPANILLDAAGKPYVADFGLALHESIQREHAGELAGTPAYMSPEQLRRETHRLDGRSDIWSLGVILYELLTGRRPFHGGTEEQLRDEILHRDPWPPRQNNPSLPGELGRICLRCLSKRASDRYPSTADLLDDLRHWLADPSSTGQGSTSATATAEPLGTDKPARIVPKGLRSFDASDADFFLELLPGPHDREGLPKSIRFWKTCIEQRDADETFTVGLIYGPSGCGKSSLVKAGLLPRLSDEVLPIYIEATGSETEVRLLKALRKHCPELEDDVDLPELIAGLRDRGGSRGRKVLIVLDQFEQWLHAHAVDEESPLVLALRQCDGGGVQCLVMVRDDFWMSETRFMQALEVPLVEGHNSAPVDLFDLDHARKVLAAFGRAHGKLPELPAEPTADETRFLERAVAGLAMDGKVVCVRLAVFAEMMKGRAWTEQSLHEVGGTEGVGVTFLEETFVARTAPPSHRAHQKAVQSVLKALLPERGTEIKGQMRSYTRLLEAAGYQDRRQDFDVLLRILDSDVRLITPTEPDETDSDGAATTPTGHGRYYQLTHDYLVPALREWLTRKQRETRRGRAELRLEERAALWNAKPESRHLPGPLEVVRFQCLTRKSQWTEVQRQMMKAAFRFNGMRLFILLTILCGVAFGLQQLVKHNDQERADSLANALLGVSPYEVSNYIDRLAPFPAEAKSALNDHFEDPDLDWNRRFRAACALAHFGQVETRFLVAGIDKARDSEASNIAAALSHDRQAALKLLQESATVAGRTKNWRGKARLAIVALYLHDPSLAEAMCQLRADPVERTSIIDEFPSFSGNLTTLARVGATIGDGHLRSALSLGLGSVSPDLLALQPQAVESWQPILERWYRDEPDSGTHSAAGFALRKWNLPVPAIASSRDPSPRGDWWHFIDGLTMVRIPTGTFEPSRDSNRLDPNSDLPSSPVAIAEFWLSDREITNGLFQEFMNDKEYERLHPGEKPVNWEGPFKFSDVPEVAFLQHPVQQVNWYDAAMFCNWLSWKAGRRPYYDLVPRSTTKEEESSQDQQDSKLGLGSGLSENREQFNVTVDPDADGFRLPKENQWEYACRATTNTEFYFGDDVRMLPQYGVSVETAFGQTAECGSRRCNGWGLFDMHGNVEEWCEIPEVVGTAGDRVCRGGSWGFDAGDCRSAFRLGGSPGYRSLSLGFRVVAVPSRAAEQEPVSGAASDSR